MESDIHLLVIKGTTGIGKTTQVQTTLQLQWYDPGSQDPKWWDGYDYEDIVVYDKFRAGPEWKIGYINRLTNKQPFGAEIKGSRIRLHPKAVIIITNYEWSEWFTHLPPKIRQTVRRRVRFLDFDRISEQRYIRPLLQCTVATYLHSCTIITDQQKLDYCDHIARQAGEDPFLSLRLKSGTGT